MKDHNEAIQDYKEFAERELKRHTVELKTRYENENVDDETMRKAYEEHRKIFEQELKGKSEALSPGKEQQGVKEELQKIAGTYVEKLTPKK